MIKNQLIIFITPTDHLDRLTKHIANNLAKKNTVVFFDFYSSFSIPRLLIDPKKRKDFINRLKTRQSTTVYFSPFTFLPLQRFIWIYFLNQKLAIKQLNSFLKKRLSQQKPILWINQADYLNILTYFNKKISVFYNKNRRFKNKINQIENRENRRKFCLLVDIVFVSSKKEFKEKKHFNNNTYLIPTTKPLKLQSKQIIQVISNTLKKEI